jgi:hypothetical protein
LDASHWRAVMDEGALEARGGHAAAGRRRRPVLVFMPAGS